MSNINRSACLFGGALFAAGVASPASADFIIGSTTHNSGFSDGPIASGYAGGGDYNTMSDIGAASGETSASVSFSTGTSSDVVLSATELSGSAVKSINSFAYFAFNTDFTVSSDVDVLVSWDADSGISEVDRRFRIFGGGGTVFSYDAANGPHSGSTTVTLLAGVNYTVDALYRTTFANGGGSFSVLIPTPATAAVLPVVGVFAARRRRS